LVGGFAASPWLFNQLQARFKPLNVTVSRPDSQTSKAVADGAIGFYCDHHVSARMSKHSYGVEFLREFDAEDEDHIARQHKLFELPSGPKLLPDAFDCILSRVSFVVFLVVLYFGFIHQYRLLVRVSELKSQQHSAGSIAQNLRAFLRFLSSKSKYGAIEVRRMLQSGFCEIKVCEKFPFPCREGSSTCPSSFLACRCIFYSLFRTGRFVTFER
jgi:hypothetical protein